MRQRPSSAGRQTVALGLLVLAATGCATLARWDRPGASEAQARRDQADCAARASREASLPAGQPIGTHPGMPADPQRTMERSTDTAAFDACMQERGYQRVTSG
jgi:hypothetical protein